VDIAQSDQVGLIGLALLHGDGVTQKDQKVDLIAGDARGDLLIPALGAGQKPKNAQSRGLGHQFAVMPVAQMLCWLRMPYRQYRLHHKFFFGVVSDKRDVHVQPPFGLYGTSCLQSESNVRRKTPVRSLYRQSLFADRISLPLTRPARFLKAFPTADLKKESASPAAQARETSLSSGTSAIIWAPA
jgi:hypothetical protein